MKVLCSTKCFHKSRTFVPGELVVVSSLDDIPAQHFVNIYGSKLVDKPLNKGGKYLVDPKTGLGKEDEKVKKYTVELTVAQIKTKLTKLKVEFAADLKKEHLLELLKEAQENALSE